MKQLLAFIILLCATPGHAQKSYKAVRIFQSELNEQYADEKNSPLPKDKLVDFDGHPFYPVDKKYKVKAKLKLTPNAESFKVQTTTTRLAEYRPYGTASFTLEGKEVVLTLYSSKSMEADPHYKDYLFLMYNDLTNGDETYGGGRYINVKKKEGKKIVIDFNQSYNPYCAYGGSYSCPIPPSENKMDIKIEAGVKFDYGKYHD